MFRKLKGFREQLMEKIGKDPSLLLSALAPIGVFVGLFGGLEGGVIIGVVIAVLGGYVAVEMGILALLIRTLISCRPLSQMEILGRLVGLSCSVGLVTGLWVFLWACVPVGLIKLVTMVW